MDRTRIELIGVGRAPVSPDRPIVPCVIYAAKSTTDVHGSIPTQFSDCREFAERNGWTVFDQGGDEGFSGYSRSRGPELNRLKGVAVELAKVYGVCMFVAQHSDRFGRGAGDAPGAADHLGELWFWAARHNVRLRSPQDDAMIDNPLLAFVAGMRAHEDSKRKSLAVKAGNRRRVRAGKHHGGPLPLGYDLRDGIRTPIQGEAVTVNRIFAEADAGKSQRAIAKDLDRDGIRTKRGGRWSQAQVARILRNKFFVGIVTDADGNEHAGEHEPIVERGLFQRVQAHLTARARTIGKGRGGRPLGAHLFVGGLLKCGFCGESMLPRTLRRGRGLYEVYLLLFAGALRERLLPAHTGSPPRRGRPHL
jgi:site-specific DNA recombinase